VAVAPTEVQAFHGALSRQLPGLHSASLYKPSHICLSRIREQPRWSIPRKFSAYRS
jgi:hypothetical protein